MTITSSTVVSAPMAAAEARQQQEVLISSQSTSGGGTITAESAGNVDVQVAAGDVVDLQQQQQETVNVKDGGVIIIQQQQTKKTTTTVVMTEGPAADAAAAAAATTTVTTVEADYTPTEVSSTTVTVSADAEEASVVEAAEEAVSDFKSDVVTVKQTTVEKKGRVTEVQPQPELTSTAVVEVAAAPAEVTTISATASEVAPAEAKREISADQSMIQEVQQDANLTTKTVITTTTVMSETAGGKTTESTVFKRVASPEPVEVVTESTKITKLVQETKQEQQPQPPSPELAAASLTAEKVVSTALVTGVAKVDHAAPEAGAEIQMVTTKSESEEVPEIATDIILIQKEDAILDKQVSAEVKKDAIVDKNISSAPKKKEEASIDGKKDTILKKKGDAISDKTEGVSVEKKKVIIVDSKKDASDEKKEDGTIVKKKTDIVEKKEEAVIEQKDHPAVEKKRGAKQEVKKEENAFTTSVKKEVVTEDKEETVLTIKDQAVLEAKKEVVFDKDIKAINGTKKVETAETNEEKKEVILEKEDVSREKKEAAVIQEKKKAANIQEKKEVPTVSEKKEAAITKEKKEAAIIQEKKEAAVIQEKKETVSIQEKKEAVSIQEKKEAAIIAEKKEAAIIQEKREIPTVSEKREAAIIRGKKEAAIIQEKKEAAVIQEKKEAVRIQEKKEAVSIQEKKEAVSIQEKREPANIQKKKEAAIPSAEKKKGEVTVAKPDPVPAPVEVKTPKAVAADLSVKEAECTIPAAPTSEPCLGPASESENPETPEMVICLQPTTEVLVISEPAGPETPEVIECFMPGPQEITTCVEISDTVRIPDYVELPTVEQRQRNGLSALNYSWTLRGALNGDFISASGSTDIKDGIASAEGTIGEGGPLNHSAWIWGGFSHFGLAWMKDGDTPNPCEKYAHHVSRHWRGEDGAHIWSSNHVTGAEGAWVGDIKVLADDFRLKGPIMEGKVSGQFPSHWIATARSDKEVDVHGLVTLKLRDGGTYTAHVHDYIKFWEPCVKITRHYWKLEIVEGEYFPTHWWHKQSAIVDANWNWGINAERMEFTWHLFGKLNNKTIEADGNGYGSGYRQHQWGNGSKGFGAHGFPNLVWALGWEGHAGLHFFTRLHKSVTNPFLSALPEGFIVKRRWYGQAGDHWKTTHDVRCTDGVIHKRVYMVGSGFKKGSCMLWDGDRSNGTPWIVKCFPQYAVAIPKGDDHIWYRSTFQFQLNNGSYYSGYWEMDIHFRKNIKMPAPFVVKFWDESWYSNAFSWHFYEREEVEHSTYDSV